MGQYNPAVITNAGLAMVAQASSGGGTILFPAAKTSSWDIPESAALAALTDLQEIRQTVSPGDAAVTNGSQIHVGALFSNANTGEEVTEPYLIQSIGLWAQIGEGPEILFAVWTSVEPDQMPAYNSVSPSSFYYDMCIPITRTENLSVSVNPAGTASSADLEALRQEVETGYIPRAQLGQPNGAASLDGGGKLPSAQLPVVIDCGVWGSAPHEDIAAHNAAPLAHQALIVDGNNVNGIDVSQTLEEHMTNPYAHQNLIVDGNNT